MLKILISQVHLKIIRLRNGDCGLRNEDFGYGIGISESIDSSNIPKKNNPKFIDYPYIPKSEIYIPKSI